MRPIDRTSSASRNKGRPWRVDVEAGNIGYLRIAGFDSGTQARSPWRWAGSAATTRSKLIGFISTLRNNPGGSFAGVGRTSDL